MEKGSLTKLRIKETARALFAGHGFRAVTMKDICDACALSRGGLYRYYPGTQQIFEEILKDLSDSDESFIRDGIKNKESASMLLEQLLAGMQAQMQDASASLSYAVFEYSLVCDNSFMSALNQRARDRWKALLSYGIECGEFNPVDTAQMTDTILYVYQGVRMWSRVIAIGPETCENIITKIRNDIERR